MTVLMKSLRDFINHYRGLVRWTLGEVPSITVLMKSLRDLMITNAKWDGTSERFHKWSK